MPTPLHLTSARVTPIPPRSPRILVLGAETVVPAVSAYLWGNLPTPLNVEDYDVVILNLVSFLTDQAQARIRPEQLPPWQQLARLLFSRGSELICIGQPPGDSRNELYTSLTWWLPAMPETLPTSGESLQVMMDEFAYYFPYVRRWSFATGAKFKPHFLGMAAYLRLIQPQANHLQVGLKAIACNRAQQPIAFKLMFRANAVEMAERRSRHAGSQLTHRPRPLVDSGTVIWLPPPTEISVDEAIHLVLTRRYGLSATPAVSAPAWSESFVLPQQQVLDVRRQQHRAAIQRLTQELEGMERQIESLARFRRLLYEHHPATLRLEVCRALQQLGAEIDPGMTLARSTASDRVLFTSPDGQSGILLVRSRSGPLLTRDLQDLHGIASRLQRYGARKALLIANTDYDKPPAQRGVPFSRRVTQVAEQAGYGLMTTPQLFEAIAQWQNQALSVDDFWTTLFATQGVFPWFLESRPSPL